MNPTKSLSQIWGEAVREARVELGLSVSELAAQVGMDVGHLSRFERGLAGIGDEYKIRIARVLGQPVADLFPYPDTSPETTCPRAASAPDGASSPTPATMAATPSTAPNAKAPAASASEGSHGNE